MVKTNVDLYPFYKANIHERRFAARLCRAFPLLMFLTVMTAIAYGCARNELLLLSICAAMNVALWLWITSTALLGMAGSFLVAGELQKRERGSPQKKVPFFSPCGEGTTSLIVKGTSPVLSDESADAAPMIASQKSPFSSPRGQSDGVMHLIVIPNYKEDIAMLSETLSSLQEAKNAQNFHVVLAMEAREGLTATDKATLLQEKFATSFGAITVAMHPADLHQEHLDDSTDSEVPGKASNLKYAVNDAYDLLAKQDPHRLPNIILTVADADCIFHPEYFSSITKDFDELREKPGAEHQWCMWQAPQVSFRDHWQAPVCSRIWTYVSSFYEFGGVCGLYWGGYHMVFSGYSLPLQLAVSAQSWDGDVIAEDHHSYLKNFFYSAHASAQQSLRAARICETHDIYNDGCQPMLKVRPIFLPVKSTPVISDEGYWQTFFERWHQAKRHAQGVAELPYAMLAIWDAMCELPLSTYSMSLFHQLARIVMRLLCMHLLPLCQAFGLALMTVYWLYFKGHLQSCPEQMRLLSWEDSLRSEYFLCAFGGAWNLLWPMAIPFACVILANYMIVSSCFFMPARHSLGKSIWHKEDSGIQPMLGSRNFSAFVWISIDCMVFLGIMMVPYGLCACLLAMWNVCFSGNRFKYITAAKATKSIKENGYGTLSSPRDSSAKESGP
jgi:hypothetical protein